MLGVLNAKQNSCLSIIPEQVCSCKLVAVQSVLYVQSYFHISKYNHHVLLRATQAAGLCPNAAGKHLSTCVPHNCTVKIMAVCQGGRIVHMPHLEMRTPSKVNKELQSVHGECTFKHHLNVSE